jgi:hypothetical protein
MDKENVIHTYTHTMEFYSVIKKDEIALFAKKHLELELITLSKISQS